MVNRENKEKATAWYDSPWKTMHNRGMAMITEVYEILNYRIEDIIEIESRIKD